MKIEKIEDLHCDAGWRTFSFLKISTADGVVGWSEYTEADGSRGLTAIIRGLAEGDTLILLESMKMEIPVMAPKDGVVKAILVKEEQPVTEGEVLATME